MYERTTEVIGRGAFSIVYKGRHRMTGVPVAIKVFKEDSHDFGINSRFSHTIQCFEKLSNGGIFNKSSSTVLKSEVSSLNGGVAVSRSSPMTQVSIGGPDSEHASVRNDSVRSVAGMSYRPTREVMRMARLTNELVVTMLDYSRTAEGKPGPDENGELYIAMELGDLSLEEFIDARAKVNAPLTVDEVKAILLDITRVVCLLHAQGLAHLDIKPANIMLFNSTYWKLIDFDGCFYASSIVDVVDSDIAFTPLYCPPEIAKAIVHISQHLKVSRWMDVWSIGMIAAELVLMKPLLEDKFVELYDKSNNDDTAFLSWLADTKTGLGLEAIGHADPELVSLLQTRMLSKDPKLRASLPDILKHPFFMRNPPTRRTWTLPSTQQPKPFSPAARTARVLPIKQKGIFVDPDQPLESDQAAEFIHEATVDDEQQPGLDISPDDITPVYSPRTEPESKRFWSVLCCGSN